MQTRDWPKHHSKLINVTHYLRGHPELFIGTVVVAVGLIISAIMLSIDPYFLRYYLDGNIHLVIARRVFDSLTPGLAQLGGVWLPITHLLLMPLVANDFLFHTGLAGTLVSISATAITAIALFRILQLQFASSTVGIFGSFVFFLNPSVIYMGIIPMMEALFMMFFMLSVYYAQKWYYLVASKQRIWFQYRALLKCALVVSAASLTRYEGWALPIGLIFIILFVKMFILRNKKEALEKHRLQALLSIVLVFGFIGITSWIAWNGVILKDPFHFFTGPYSAAAQSEGRGHNEGYKLNPMASFSLIFDAAAQMYGLHILAISLFGIAVYFFSGTKRKRLRFYLLTVLMMMAPILVDFGAMVQGSGEIVRLGDSWFNGRYLIFIAPLLAFGSSSLLNYVIEGTSRRKTLIIITIVVIAGSYTFTFASQTFEYGKAVALNDVGLLPASKGALNAVETGKQLATLYDQGYIVLLTLSDSNAWIMVESHIPLKNFIDLSNRQYWEVAKQSPWVYGNYLVLQKPVDMPTFDPLRNHAMYWHNNKGILLKYYDVIYENDQFEILKKN